MAYDYYRKNENNTSTRVVDLSLAKTYETIRLRLAFISNREIRMWKALSIVTFFAGIFAAAIYFSAYQLEVTGVSAETTSWSSGQQ